MRRNILDELYGLLTDRNIEYCENRKPDKPLKMLRTNSGNRWIKISDCPMHKIYLVNGCCLFIKLLHCALKLDRSKNFVAILVWLSLFFQRFMQWWTGLHRLIFLNGNGLNCLSSMHTRHKRRKYLLFMSFVQWHYK